ncbi:unnamed protein product [Effrenium voratum]|uniref:Photosystem I reaction center subunit III n=1 Tax=Effrenium voratum TaxID=2562239 RepID=A0AA36N3P6_9DINO|nr:unnamed protein product [Effrenium voratum]CAJ1397490.1 unnamed protein product [Effrenium voratum]CAJ1397491.1 unnamed protein product [Effrenium voratum]CAJ1414913.1 unnamed protein product [Effrenium voratum]CAJ1414981.1 unnamed protein product [Effrenium voratum]|eukprot:CAMPEP_0181476898 /NCGR_PEP_ID=MMETSP1110-20121109/41942_1 /TAXON_ID=174948 /ORGANISM="Symbiodinium sp., Strain CCMP421" /LENGTH=279 /DNA_ID=CAMNT_0023602191 /DNA_START=40 /DNA_END=879 /DNA_ORIENTATION=-
MARPGSALLCVAAATVLVAAAVAFVGSPAGTHAPSTGRSVELGSRALPPAAESAAASGEAAAEQSGAESFMKWTAAGLLAGLVMAVSSSTPASALPKPTDMFGGVDIDLENTPEHWTIKASKRLELCKDNKAYKKKFKDELYKTEKQQKKYATGSAVYARFNKKIAQIKNRQEAYGDRLCGKQDGNPRVVATGEWNVRASVMWPASIFLYTAGWIGWAGRSYLIRTNDETKELNIDVPLALTCMASGFSWPVAAWQEIVNGEMAVPSSQIHPGGPYTQS